MAQQSGTEFEAALAEVYGEGFADALGSPSPLKGDSPANLLELFGEERDWQFGPGD